VAERAREDYEEERQRAEAALGQVRELKVLLEELRAAAAAQGEAEEASGEQRGRHGEGVVDQLHRDVADLRGILLAKVILCRIPTHTGLFC